MFQISFFTTRYVSIAVWLLINHYLVFHWVSLQVQQRLHFPQRRRLRQFDFRSSQEKVCPEGRRNCLGKKVVRWRVQETLTLLLCGSWVKKLSFFFICIIIWTVERHVVGYHMWCIHWPFIFRRWADLNYCIYRWIYDFANTLCHLCSNKLCLRYLISNINFTMLVFFEGKIVMSS